VSTAHGFTDVTSGQQPLIGLLETLEVAVGSVVEDNPVQNGRTAA
jgi:hypothetical protein